MPTPEAGKPAFDRAVVRRQLEKILAHALFTRSERMGRFLRLAVERTIDGKGGDLKEYLIGVEVFDRKSDYDPRTDPIVRVEARRLRSKLRAYYEGDGRNDSIRIELVSGCYAPRISGETAGGGHPPPAAERSQGPITLVVLPLANLSANPENEYLSHGMTEELIHALTKAPGMRVVAWTTAVQLSGREQDIQALREKWNIDIVLTGSVRAAGASLRVRAQLIDTRSGLYLWSETFDRQMQDAFAIQEEIAHAIVRTLRVQLSGARERALAPRSGAGAVAYDWYLKGRHYWRERTPEGLARSLQAFEAALAADRSSALAHAGLADAYTLLMDYGLMSPADGMPKARSEAARAVELDPELAEAYATLAVIRSHYDHDWEGAECLYRRSIALNPGYATAHQWLGVDCYGMLGRFDEALSEIEIARELDPLSSIIHEAFPFLRILARQYDLAIEASRQITESDPGFYKGYTTMGRAYAQQGRYADAIAMLEKGRSLAGDIPNILAALGQIHGLSGDRKRAREFLARLAELARARYIPATSFAIVHLGLGEKKRALDWLERGCERRDLSLAALKMHPIYDPLRGDPRFEELLRKLGFPAEPRP